MSVYPPPGLCTETWMYLTRSLPTTYIYVVEMHYLYAYDVNIRRRFNSLFLTFISELGTPNFGWIFISIDPVYLANITPKNVYLVLQNTCWIKGKNWPEPSKVQRTALSLMWHALSVLTDFRAGPWWPGEVRAPPHVSHLSPRPL